MSTKKNEIHGLVRAICEFTVCLDFHFAKRVEGWCLHNGGIDYEVLRSVRDSCDVLVSIWPARKPEYVFEARFDTFGGGDWRYYEGNFCGDYPAEELASAVVERISFDCIDGYVGGMPNKTFKSIVSREKRKNCI